MARDVWPHVVTLGGGAGSYQVLRGLRDRPVRVSAVVSVFDNGGSSGAIREELGQLPPGDIRQCLLALAPDDGAGAGAGLVRRLFEYRFKEGRALKGHSLGNLALAALTELEGGLPGAVRAAQALLQARGDVLPVSICDAHLVATLDDGSEVIGEAEIDARRGTDGRVIRSVRLTRRAKAYPPALEALASADLIILGPGDLYTSLLPNLLVEGVADAVASSPGRRVLVLNLMTKPGETDRFKASDFVRQALHYLDQGRIDYLLANTESPPEEERLRYARAGAFPVELDIDACAPLVGEVVMRDMLCASGGCFLRHDPARLADALCELLGRSERRPV